MQDVESDTYLLLSYLIEKLSLDFPEDLLKGIDSMLETLGTVIQVGDGKDAPI